LKTINHWQKSVLSYPYTINPTSSNNRSGNSIIDSISLSKTNNSLEQIIIEKLKDCLTTSHTRERFIERVVECFDAKLLKSPIEGKTNDAVIYTIKQKSNESPTYGLKIYPDVFIQSASVFSSQRFIEKLNALDVLSRVLCAPEHLFRENTSEIPDRIVLYEFVEGSPLSKLFLNSRNQDLFLKQKQTILEKLLKEGYWLDAYTLFDLNNFCVTTDGKLVLTDWNGLQQNAGTPPQFNKRFVERMMERVKNCYARMNDEQSVDIIWRGL
jgi:hypothetical protein